MNQVYKEFDDVLRANTCGEVLKYSATFDMCNTNTTAGSMKVEGWIKGKNNVDDANYCYAYAHLKIRFPRELDDPSLSPPKEQIRLSYNSMEYNGKNDELWGRSVADLEYIEYSFKAESCGTDVKEDCPQWFYLSVYTRKDVGNTNYDCRYDFEPTCGGEPYIRAGMGWTTVRFNLHFHSSRSNG